MTARIDVVIDLPADHQYHLATVAAVSRSGAAAGLDVEINVVRTREINDRYFDDLPRGVVIGPGTP